MGSGAVTLQCKMSGNSCSAALCQGSRTSEKLLPAYRLLSWMALKQTLTSPNARCWQGAGLIHSLCLEGGELRVCLVSFQLKSSFRVGRAAGSGMHRALLQVPPGVCSIS